MLPEKMKSPRGARTLFAAQFGCVGFLSFRFEMMLRAPENPTTVNRDPQHGGQNYFLFFVFFASNRLRGEANASDR